MYDIIWHNCLKDIANGICVQDIQIKPEVIDPDDAEMLQDLIVSAVNTALEQAESEMAETMQRFTGGMSMPGLF